MTKLRFFSVLLIAAFGAYIAAGAMLVLGAVGANGMSDGGGF